MNTCTLQREVLGTCPKCGEPCVWDPDSHPKLYVQTYTGTVNATGESLTWKKHWHWKCRPRRPADQPPALP